MTKLIDWLRFREMNSRERSGINTASTFSEQRKNENKNLRKKEEKSDFGLPKMEEEVNIEWPDEKTK